MTLYDGLTHYVEVVAVYENNKRSVSIIGKISDDVNVNEIEDTQCRVYPNPVDDMLYIDVDTEIEEVVVYDIYGRHQVTETASHQGNLAIDVSNLKAGIYFVKINTEEGNIVKQIIKD
ncbi:MAG: T9SS type A sorting domain-containing protein [Bacteroidales bacterium]|nr:T9SS type A sorting domain-containing protein [Bacteroidales bacterium]